MAAALVLVRGLRSPLLVRQSRPFHPSGIRVALKTGTWTGTRLKVLGPVTATLVADEVEEGGDQVPPLQHNVAPLDAQGVAVFSRLQCAQGTRKRPVRVRFEVAVAVGSHRFLVTSEPSPPLIILTNERQWRHGEGVLLLRHAGLGPGTPPCSWAHLGNVLHLRYLKATKQRLRDPPRPLTRHDLTWIRHRGGLALMDAVTAHQVSPLWEWLGAALFRLRFQRGLLALWLRGLVAGWLTRAEAEALLCPSPPTPAPLPGTFLVRFSEQAAGLFAIAYLPPSGEVRHYLLGTQDLAARRTLADFLQAAGALAYLLQRLPRGWAGQDKGAALAPFLSRPQAAPAAERLGYDKRL